MVRVLKVQIDMKADMNIKAEDAILHWAMRWAAMLVSRFKTSEDGMTAYQRPRGNTCEIEVVPFGDKVWYRRLGGDGRNMSLESKWGEDIWLGHTRDS